VCVFVTLALRGKMLFGGFAGLYSSPVLQALIYFVLGHTSLMGMCISGHVHSSSISIICAKPTLGRTGPSSMCLFPLFDFDSDSDSATQVISQIVLSISSFFILSYAELASLTGFLR
jgi:hypothetical protein